MALVLGQKGKQTGKPRPNPKLRNAENEPLAEDVAAYLERELPPHASDAWSDDDKTRVGHEIPFNRHFYKRFFASAIEGLTDEDLERPGDLGRGDPEWGT